MNYTKYDEDKVYRISVSGYAGPVPASEALRALAQDWLELHEKLDELTRALKTLTSSGPTTR